MRLPVKCSSVPLTFELGSSHRALPQTSGANNDSYIQRTIEPDAKLASLKVDLNELQHRYDTLLETKEKAAAMYKDDYKRWNDYKKWVRDHGILERKRKRGITGVESRGPSSHRSRKNRVSETSEKDDFQLREYGTCLVYRLCLAGVDDFVSFFA